MCLIFRNGCYVCTGIAVRVYMGIYVRICMLDTNLQKNKYIYKK